MSTHNVYAGIICPDCGRGFTTSQIGITVAELFRNNKAIYKIYNADLKECGCGNEVIHGMGKPIEHYQDGFAEEQERVSEMLEEDDPKLYLWLEPGAGSTSLGPGVIKKYLPENIRRISNEL